MKQKDLQTLTEQTGLFCQQHGSKLVFSSYAEELLQDILQAIHEDPSQRTAYVALIEQVRIACDCPEKLMGNIIGSIGYRLYNSASPALAETILQLAVEISPDIDVKNNLAYIRRRHKDVLHSSDAEIIDLLMDGVQKRDALSLVNMALLFSRNLATPSDWELADRMIRLLKPDDHGIEAVTAWWGDLAKVEDDEGLLVMLWLERHKKCESPHNTAVHYKVLLRRCPDIPQWIFEPYTTA